MVHAIIFQPCLYHLSWWLSARASSYHIGRHYIAPSHLPLPYGTLLIAIYPELLSF